MCTLNKEQFWFCLLHAPLNPVFGKNCCGVSYRHTVHYHYYSTDERPDEKWLVFDGPVDTLWIESMNSVMDDNKVLTLINSERISMPPQVNCLCLLISLELQSGLMFVQKHLLGKYMHNYVWFVLHVCTVLKLLSAVVVFLVLQVSLLFEVEDLAVASPATVSRCGMVYNDWTDLGWDPYVKSWLSKRKDKVCTSTCTCTCCVFSIAFISTCIHYYTSNVLYV